MSMYLSIHTCVLNNESVFVFSSSFACQFVVDFYCTRMICLFDGGYVIGKFNELYCIYKYIYIHNTREKKYSSKSTIILAI